ncbi:MAG: T9SS type A sorting domain-containing protein [Ignavibacteriae bacterium]|nr:T9SS C-terminal target domain-containing protein [Ignavibacteriota bacterium]NOG99091.1 T9SS type A sorting domain-containing protein [Ignavibacteriota bacterium]
MKVSSQWLLLILSLLIFGIHEEISAQIYIHENQVEPYISPIEKFKHDTSFSNPFQFPDYPKNLQTELDSHFSPERIRLFDKSAADTTIYLLDSLLYSSDFNEKKMVITYNHNLNEIIQLNQFWDSTSFNWINEDEISKVYDEHGNLLSETRKLWDIITKLFSNITRVEYVYNHNNNNMILRISHYWDNKQESWIYSNSEKYKFDLRGYLTESLLQSWNDKLNEWVNQIRNQYKNNSAGKQTMHTYEEWDTAASTWQPLFCYYYEYDIWGNRTSTLFQSINYESMELYNFYLHQIKYLNNKIVNSLIDYFNPAGETERKLRFEYSYFENGEQKIIQSQLFDFSSQSWVNRSRTSFSYEIDNAKTELLEHWNSDTMAWEKKFRWISLFDQNNNIITGLREVWSKADENWQKDQRKNQEFDNNNNLIYVNFEWWNGSEWQPYSNIVSIISDNIKIGVSATNLKAYYSPYIKNIPETTFNKPVFQLSQNYPNPFNPITIITFEIPELQYVTINIYNALGEKISTLVDGLRAEGTYKEIFNGAHLSSGVYFYQITAGSFNQVRKMLLLK